MDYLPHTPSGTRRLLTVNDNPEEDAANIIASDEGRESGTEDNEIM